MSKRETRMQDIQYQIEDMDINGFSENTEEHYYYLDLLDTLNDLNQTSDEEYESEYITPKQAIRKGFNL